MEYQEFINTIAEHQTANIKALNIPESSAPGSIPPSFKELIPDVINIIATHFDELADGMPAIGIFGLQTMSFAIKSDLPLNTNRIITQTSAKNHLCCVLYYLPLSTSATLDADSKMDWRQYKSIVLDFTRGSVMDQERYLRFAIDITGNPGKLYGRINAKKVASAWHHYHLSKAVSGF